MKKLFVIIALSVVACAPPPKQITQCQDIGINTGAPDFTQKHKPAEIEGYYSCTEKQLQEVATPPAESLGLRLLKASKASVLAPSDNSLTPQQYASMYNALEYQKNLWLEVISKEKKPHSAKEDWLKYAQQERLVIASNRNADASQQAVHAAAVAADNTHQPYTCMANGPFLNCN